jgi:hypothetical protein
MAGLFEGKVLTTPSGSEATSGQTPQWYQDLLYDQMMSARAIAGQSFEPYALPRVAGQTPDQTAAYQSVRQNIGAWQPSYDVAMRGTQSLAGETPGVTSGVGYMQAAAGYNPMLAQQPYINQSSAELGNALRQNAFNVAAPGTYQAMGMSGLETASPFLMQGSALGMNAAQSSAPLAQQYMNPYTDAVTGQIAQLGARNLQENLLPAVSDQFVRAGQFGGSRMGEFGQRALRDTQEAVLREQSQALQAGYGQALGASQADLARMLQVGSQQANLGQIAGGMTQAQQQALMQGSQSLAGIRGQDLNRIMQGAEQYAGLGQQAAGATQQYGNMLQSIGQGIGGLSLNEAQRQQSALGQLADMGRSQQQMFAQDAASMEAIGQAQQAQKQRELSAAYEQFMEQQRYPQAQMDWYQAQLKGAGQYLPSTTTQSGYTTQVGMSPLAQVAGLYTGYQGLKNLGS